MHRNFLRSAMLLGVLVALGVAIEALARLAVQVAVSAWVATTVAALAGAASMWVFSRRTEIGCRQFAAAVGSQTDHMMIGAVPAPMHFCGRRTSAIPAR